MLFNIVGGVVMRAQHKPQFLPKLINLGILQSM